MTMTCILGRFCRIGVFLSISLLASCATGSGSHRADDASSPAATAVVSQAQALLTDLGYEPGAVDGIEGPRTAEAIRAFQTATGPEVDGRASESLVALLKAEKQARLVVQAQRKLAALGYDPGPVDGKAGARTRKAVAAFQRAQDLDSDGLVTPDLIAQLAAVGGAAEDGSAVSRSEPEPRAPAATGDKSAQIAALDEGSPVLRPGDRLTLSYYGTQSTSAEIKIDPDGGLALPEVGRVQAAGLDLEELRDQVTVKLIESYLGKLDVVVRLVATGDRDGGPDPASQVLSPGDRLSVSTAAGDASPAELEVGPDGWLLMPEAGKLRAAGLGLTELRDEITVKLLEAYMGKLKVKVRLAEAHGQPPLAE
jgi:peptidoglycan hydrolase-like protein with peptidoglycan-binding domain